MAKRRMYSECGGGEVTVTVEPDHNAEPDRYGKGEGLGKACRTKACKSRRRGRK